jgi:hypothetical protein
MSRTAPARQSKTPAAADGIRMLPESGSQSPAPGLLKILLGTLKYGLASFGPPQSA